MKAAPVCPLEEACITIERWRKEGRRIVFTNGCFDLLHPGHVSYLFKARALGNVLVVGINDDDSVRCLKGGDRPILPLKDRATMLSALKPVDLVIPFHETTPLSLILRIMPDVLVKGGDYTLETIVGANEVRAWGGEVHILPFVSGYSTTALIRRIQRCA